MKGTTPSECVVAFDFKNVDKSVHEVWLATSFTLPIGTSLGSMQGNYMPRLNVGITTRPATMTAVSRSSRLFHHFPLNCDANTPNHDTYPLGGIGLASDDSCPSATTPHWLRRQQGALCIQLDINAFALKTLMKLLNVLKLFFLLLCYQKIYQR